MASLIDKLRQAQPQSNRPTKPPATCCMMRQSAYEPQVYPPAPISAHAFHLLSGQSSQAGYRPEELLFLDTETTGLKGGAGTIAFLVGMGRFEDGAFTVRQYLMRDYDEEPFVLHAVADALDQSAAIISFNGASFDMPLLQSRFVMNRMPWRWEDKPHLDLLHIARRVYKLRLQRCSLAQLEAEVFSMPREDDLPGKEVPERYFQYLKIREEALLEDILRHNAQDIASMAKLLHRLNSLHLAPEAAGDQRDIFSLGRVMERRGQKDAAIRCFRACSDKGLQDMARWRLSHMLRRQGEYDAAARELDSMRLTGGGPKVYIELAKIYEHRFRDPIRALELVRQGMVYCSEPRFGYDEKSPEYLDLAHRAKRLIHKTGGR